jgi:uncharacterized protein (DUF2237 family)
MKRDATGRRKSGGRDEAGTQASARAGGGRWCSCWRWRWRREEEESRRPPLVVVAAAEEEADSLTHITHPKDDYFFVLCAATAIHASCIIGRTGHPTQRQR